MPLNRARRFSSVCLSFLLAIGLAPLLSAEDAAPEKTMVRFESDVLPILKAHCLKCHAGAEPAQGLRLTTPRDILRGGDSGAAMRIAAAESSLLWEKLASNEMPKDGPPLSAAEKGIIRSWINEGAAAEVTDDERDDIESDGDEGAAQHWSFRPPVRPRMPDIRDRARARNAIDFFVISALEKNELSLSPEASRAVLLRRVYYDLIGLPPSPQEVNAFLSDTGERAYEHMIDRLLANPHYGERWGRHWLDVAGFAESAGVLAEDRPLPTAYRYRDYVIRAFNADKPYDRFLQEQIAGDELSDYWTAYEQLDKLPAAVVEAVTATGFLRCAPDSSRPDFTTIKNADALYFYPTLNDTLQILSSATMGLTVQCARCHNHKFDPITQVDYYQMQSILMSGLRPRQWIPQMERVIPVASAVQKKAADEHNARVDAEVARLQAELADHRAPFKQQLLTSRLQQLPENIREDVRTAITKAAEQRSAVEQYLAEKFTSLLPPDDAALDKVLAETYPDYSAKLTKNTEQIAAQQRQRIAFDELRAFYDLPGPVTTPLLRRGDALTPGPLVEPGVVAALATPLPFEWSPPADNAKSSGRRLAFARWLTQPQHPLTARVMVNRIWLHHFGEGIVSTPDDFGTMGAPPSHPELLDWLACEFVDSGWSIKYLHRLILNSTTYRQQSAFDASSHIRSVQVDPDNRLLWRQRMRRVDAEPLRDAILQAGGSLDLQMFGGSSPLARRPNGEVTVADGANDRRRSIYLQILRSNPLTMLQAYDQPVMETNCTRRTRSTVSTQALTVLNSDTTVQIAKAFADRITAEASDPGSWSSLAAAVAFSRPIEDDEHSIFEQFMADQQARYEAIGKATDEARHAALVDLCHMLLATNEFLYID